MNFKIQVLNTIYSTSETIATDLENIKNTNGEIIRIKEDIEETE